MEKVKIEEIQSTAKKQRIATHTHIKGLGLEVLLLSTLYRSNFVSFYKDLKLIAFVWYAQESQSIVFLDVTASRLLYTRVAQCSLGFKVLGFIRFYS